jgi:hypothetical protein
VKSQIPEGAYCVLKTKALVPFIQWIEFSDLANKRTPANWNKWKVFYSFVEYRLDLPRGESGRQSVVHPSNLY